MKKPQWISVGVAILLVIIIFKFGRTVGVRAPVSETPHAALDGHDHAGLSEPLTTDTILYNARKLLSTEQVNRITQLENSITRGDVKTQQIHVFHQLSSFWGDSMGIFAPYAWYQAEAARLENSEKTLTFAARLMLGGLDRESEPALRQWEALQAKDLFERSLKINPSNDSAKVGIGATYLFGGISDQPMTGITMIREVADRDSNFVYAQMTLAKGSLLSGQLDRAVTRLESVHRRNPDNLDAILMLAEVAERKQDKAAAISWYQQSLPYVGREDARTEILARIAELKGADLKK